MELDERDLMTVLTVVDRLRRDLRSNMFAIGALAGSLHSEGALTERALVTWKELLEVQYDALHPVVVALSSTGAATVPEDEARKALDQEFAALTSKVYEAYQRAKGESEAEGGA